MADTTFVDKITVVQADWLNDVNDVVYTDLGGVGGIGASGGAARVGFTQGVTNAVTTNVQEVLRETISPLRFGAVGNGITNDGPALNLAFDYLRSRIATFSNSRTVVTLDLGGKNYRTDISLNATGLLGDWCVQNGTIIGHCTGKAVLDTIGSRFGRLENLLIIGNQINRPSVGIQAARSSTNPGQFGFCDGMYWDKISTYGYFSTTAVYTYGQEGTTYSRCKFWNSDRDAYVAIHTGYNTIPMTSDYLTPTTGSVSYINNKYVGCDYLPLPENENATITGITQANPAVVTAPGHPFANGQTVTIGLVNGMGEINNVVAVVASATANTFALTGVNSTTFGAYTSGGWAVRARTKPTVYFARGEQHHFDTCYVVNYGSDSFAIDFPDAQVLKSVWLDILFEGQGSRSHLRFLNSGQIRDFKFETYNTHCRDYVISVDSGTAGVVNLYKSKITVTNFSVSTPTLVDTPSRYAFYDAEVFVPTSATFSTTTLLDRFIGVIGNTSAERVHVNAKYADYRDGAYTPTVTSATGTLTSVTGISGYAKRYGDLVYVEMQATVTTAGTGAGSLNFSLPFTAAGRNFLNGREFGVTGAAVNGIISAGGTTVNYVKYDGTTPITNGAVVSAGGWYRVA